LTFASDYYSQQPNVSVYGTFSSQTLSTFSLNSLSFGQVVYENDLITGNSNPVNATFQSLFSSSSIPVMVTPAYRGLGLPAAAWLTFSNLMEVVTKS
jgi:hypothetical protein